MGKNLRILALGILLWGGLVVGQGLAQTLPSDLPVSLAFTGSTSTFLFNDPTDPIGVELSMENVGATTIVTFEKFRTRPHHLFLQIRGPQGQLITATEFGRVGESEGPPPRVFLVAPSPGAPLVLVQGERVDFLPGTADPVPPGPFSQSQPIQDLKSFYTLPTAGFYEAQAVLPFRAYDAAQLFISGGAPAAPIEATIFQGSLRSRPLRFALVADADGDGFCFPVQDSRLCGNPQPDCNDGNAAINPGVTEVPNNGVDDDCNPATPDAVSTANGTLQVTANRHTVGDGQRPGSNKEPLVGLPVRAFNTADPCVAQFSSSWQNYPNTWGACSVPDSQMGETDGGGVVTFSLPPGDYRVIGEYQDTAGNRTLYIGVSAGGIVEGGTEQKFLQVIVKNDGKVVPAKYTKKTGSELLIIEPEYVEWNSTEELYPFVFESLGDWTVTTTVIPPEGFVPDVPSLTEEVHSELKAVQFTLTDVGTEWTDTAVTHELTHKGKKEKVKTKIGVRLSKQLAIAKGLNQFGGPPGLMKSK